MSSQMTSCPQCHQQIDRKAPRCDHCSTLTPYYWQRLRSQALVLGFVGILLLLGYLFS